MFLCKERLMGANPFVLSNSDILSQIYFEVGSATMGIHIGRIFPLPTTPIIPSTWGAGFLATMFVLRQLAIGPMINISANLGKSDFLSWEFGIGT